MTKLKWSKFNPEEKIRHIYHLGWKCCQGPRAGKSADKEIWRIIEIERKGGIKC